MNHARRSGSEVRLQCRYDPYVYLAHTEPVTMPCVKKGKPSSSALAFSSSSSVSDGKVMIPRPRTLRLQLAFLNEIHDPGTKHQGKRRIAEQCEDNV